MSRLQSQWQRLYEPASDGRDGAVRALVLEVARPADWEPLSRVWRGVQADLQLPAPAIAVSGSDGLQLWFSLREAVDVAAAALFLQRLQDRYLADLAPARVRAMPSTREPAWQAPRVPAPQPGTENWSAFVAPDLAPVFGETPWLDIPPGTDGQADLLARLQSIEPAAFQAAMECLAGPATSAQPAAAAPVPASATSDVDPRRFLQRVLNDESVALALRIEAAKALLGRA
ncbi:hypothetical protein [Pelomonas cellulosilytica]|uniref:DUF721 domain-containing protein n=1 Tax=Pelomonas cellulosilytica TaxID=2906762 RepID=A0ABS8XY25_9BURK|nr:hypothetical protein [Pelomonas sp. P8]MCE4555613.1 hypothetical protein [Pelomonas sp. P8]